MKISNLGSKFQEILQVTKRLPCRGLPFRSRRDRQLRKVTVHFIFLVRLPLLPAALLLALSVNRRRRLTPQPVTWRFRS